MERRDFLKTLGLFSGTLVTSWNFNFGQERLVSQLDLPDKDLIPGEPVYYFSTCTECPAHCGLMVFDRLGGDLTVFRQQRVGHPVGKGRVRGVADLDELEGQVSLQGVEHWPGAAVAGVHHHLEGFEAGEVDVAQQVGDIIGEGVRGFPGPPRSGGGG